MSLPFCPQYIKVLYLVGNISCRLLTWWQPFYLRKRCNLKQLCISLLTEGIEYHFKCLLTICISYFENHLFSQLAHSVTEWFGWVVVISFSSLFNVGINPVWCVVSKEIKKNMCSQVLLSVNHPAGGVTLYISRTALGPRSSQALQQWMTDKAAPPTYLLLPQAESYHSTVIPSLW